MTHPNRPGVYDVTIPTGADGGRCVHGGVLQNVLVTDPGAPSVGAYSIAGVFCYAPSNRGRIGIFIRCGDGVEWTRVEVPDGI